MGVSLDVPGLTFAFTAGLLSIFSPCGYALLPGFISYYLGQDFSVVRAITGGVACTLGLVTVYTAVGALASGLGVALPSIIPVMSLLSGLFVLAMGFAVITELPVPFIQFNVTPSSRKGLMGLYTFGVVYGLAGVGCSAPIFLSVLLYSVSDSLVSGVVTFAVYAMGMGLPLVVTSVLVAEAKEYAIRRISGATERLRRLSGGVLLIVGVYLLYDYYVTYVL
ncbi:MAG TPA: cytochrome c biogenesis CcdA family protein [Patescibacteria group bacterium]|nr:cytochrome c biogenesis CcdA family protein [Patescibacteria group bacterium]